ncbi:uncharacterized protein PHALS_14699 [Plasmopara halstedii]|uniref:Uncharacterized protein n=1 Tax=Plasmopara halstedii TaxID=4781 RepID=A0A0P1APD4_PLAHL|nr:uncharacterized protein PHALS_14699 [Plasmopara halstedii]CEG43271.1 hypothetical protein PHALS_14699 [Plasmopara halstedii]|eukprot:XP_024579640.1 hypothetical protein PHALS_14699 [Plasmopara halstedii]
MCRKCTQHPDKQACCMYCQEEGGAFQFFKATTIISFISLKQPLAKIIIEITVIPPSATIV